MNTQNITVLPFLLTPLLLLLPFFLLLSRIRGNIACPVLQRQGIYEVFPNLSHLLAFNIIIVVDAYRIEIYGIRKNRLISAVSRYSRSDSITSARVPRI